VSHKFAQSTSLLQTTELIFLCELEKLMRRMLSLKIATILIKEVNPNVDERPSLLLQICFSWVIWINKAEFENSDNLKKISC